jgi:hypothetical protein
LDEDEWVDAASSGDPSCERRPWRERQPSWRTEWVVAVTAARTVGTTAEIAASTGGIGDEAPNARTCVLLSRHHAVGRQLLVYHVVNGRRIIGEEPT